MQFEELIDFLVSEGGILDVDFACPEGKFYFFESCDEFAEVATQDGL